MISRRTLLALLGALRGAHSQATPPAGVVAPAPSVGGTPVPLAVTPAPAPAPTGTVPPNLAPIYPDVSDPGCVPMSECSKTNQNVLVGVDRGLCVQVGATAAESQCWDACNTTHALTDYGGTAATRGQQSAIAMMVQQLRTGVRAGSCPGAKGTTSECNAGERCTPPGLTYLRGMCTSTATGNACLDMCDTKIPIETFKAQPGKQAGTVTLVQQVRDGKDPLGRTTCPGPSVWTWLWIPLMLCCCLGICAGSYALFQYYRKTFARQKSQNKSFYPEPEQQPFVEEYPQPAPFPEEAPREMEPVVEPVGEMPFIQEDLAAKAMMEEPMIDPGFTAAPAAAPLFSGIGGLTAPTLTQPGTFTTPITSVPMTTSYSQAGALTSGYGGYPTTGMAPYGAYGTYPAATTSMRIG